MEEQPTSRMIRIAILDTGIDPDQVEAPVFDTHLNLSASGEAGSTWDDHGHGTKIARLAASYGRGFLTLLPIKVADGQGEAAGDSLCRGMEAAMGLQADVILICMNVAPSEEAEELAAQIAEASAMGIPVVVSAGNGGTDVKNSIPANQKDAVVVGALGQEGGLAEYSNYGETVDYAVDGVFEGEFGTSYSAARFAGMAAAVLARGGSMEQAMVMFGEDIKMADK